MVLKSSNKALQRPKHDFWPNVMISNNIKWLWNQSDRYNKKTVGKWKKSSLT